MRKLIIPMIFFGMAGVAHAADVYLYDLLKDPLHARSWKAALASAKGVPAWVKDDNRFISGAAESVSIGADVYSINAIAKQHATNDGQAAVMFNASGSQAWIEIQDTGEATRYLGNPSAAQRSALDKALAE